MPAPCRSSSAQPDGKAEALFLDSVVPGATLADGLQKALAEAMAKLPIPKVMQYQLESRRRRADFQPGWTSVNFVRPAHGLVALHGADVVPVTALGLQAGRSTQGHRFEAAVNPVTLPMPTATPRNCRRRRGDRQLCRAPRRDRAPAERGGRQRRQGLKPIDDDALLDEVTALVERPNVLLCQFEPEFLDVPQECLILTMKANQKYFPLLDAGAS
jgi:glycyl-tRNA synthetase beta chain